MGDVANFLQENVTPVQSAKNKDFLDAIQNLMGERDRIAGLGSTASTNYGKATGSLFDALNLTQQAAEGKAPSVAQSFLQRGLDQSIANQMALANTGPAAGNIARQKTAADAGAALRQQAANDSARLRAEEMAAARGQYGQLASGATGTTQAGLLGLSSQQLDAIKSALAGQTSALGIEQQRLNQQGKQGADVMGGIAGGVAQGLASSDKNLKENIELTDDVKKFLDKISEVSFDYKEKDGVAGRTPGKHIGVIAQQVEKAPGGKSMIVETEAGKMIDGPSAIGTLLAAAAHLNKRVSKIENGKKREAA